MIQLCTAKTQFFRTLLLCMLPAHLQCADATRVPSTAQGSRIPGSFSFPAEFQFGLATAPGHAEDQLQDAWAQWAAKGKVPGFKTTPNPLERLRFWSEPEIEIDLAADTGIGLYRFGIDWTRLVPEQPGSARCPKEPMGICPAGIQDFSAWQHYVDRHFSYLQSKNLKIMLTLFHHSGPQWFIDSGGWTNPINVEYFAAFVESLLSSLNKEKIVIDYWITINEPSLMALMSYLLQDWPVHGADQGFDLSKLLQLATGHTVLSDYFNAIDHMAAAHSLAFKLIKAKRPKSELVGFAQNLGLYTPANPNNLLTGALQRKLADYARENFLYLFLRKALQESDFLGVNYYGEEFIDLGGLALVKNKEYMDSGRAINPLGLYKVVKEVIAEFSYDKPIFITENGISDQQDALRPSYLFEHLLAVAELVNDGVPVLGYIFWTLSDNWEWADGYCPKFGLYEVDRQDSLLKTRAARVDSLSLFKQIVATHQLLPKDRELAWDKVQASVGKPRPLCRSLDGRTALGEADWSIRKYLNHDWRFQAP